MMVHISTIQRRCLHHNGAFIIFSVYRAHVNTPAKKEFCEANHPIYSASQSPAGAPT